MSRSRNKVIALTMGDPCGVGPEVIAAALAGLRPVKGLEFLVVGHEDVFMRYWPGRKAVPSFVHVAQGSGAVHQAGKPTAASGLDSLLYLKQAVKMLKSGVVHGVVTGPVAKEAVIPFHPGFKGHTTFFAEEFSRKNVEMLFVADDLKVVLLTRHIPLKDVAGAVTAKKVFDVTATTAAFLKDRWGVRKPRVAVCGLNPHAGEGGHMGKEEGLEISPGIKRLCQAGWDVSGPLPADTLFEPRVRRGYDLIVSMYHDQALTALKAQYFDRLVNVTVGLPFVRTSPAHGTAFGIAGKGLAGAGSMSSAIKTAMELV